MEMTDEGPTSPDRRRLHRLWRGDTVLKLARQRRGDFVAAITRDAGLSRSRATRLVGNIHKL